MKVTWTTAVLCALALLAQMQEAAAAPKQRREENACRSVGALKFDASQRPMQRVREATSELARRCRNGHWKD